MLLCPPSSEALSDTSLRDLLPRLQAEVFAAVSTLRGIDVIGADEVAKIYPVNEIDDPENNHQAHIPFTTEYWTALGTALARRARVFLSQPYKVVVVDADNTLWGGVVGEVGASGVRLDGEWKNIQEFLRQLKTRGMLLAIASKNRQEDVAEVFKRKDMTLRREDFVAWKINWERKSDNIGALAKELELGLDSFIFLDDNPVECAEVSAHTPAVALVLPADTNTNSRFSAPCVGLRSSRRHGGG